MVSVTDGLPGAEGTGDAVTVIVNVFLIDADALSVTMYLTVDVPMADGLPLTVRLDAVNDNPAGRPFTSYLYGAVPPNADGSVNDVNTPFVSVRFDRFWRLRGVGAVVVPYRMRDHEDSPASFLART